MSYCLMLFVWTKPQKTRCGSQKQRWGYQTLQHTSFSLLQIWKKNNQNDVAVATVQTIIISSRQESDRSVISHGSRPSDPNLVPRFQLLNGSWQLCVKMAKRTWHFHLESPPVNAVIPFVMLRMPCMKCHFPKVCMVWASGGLKSRFSFIDFRSVLGRWPYSNIVCAICLKLN